MATLSVHHSPCTIHPFSLLCTGPASGRELPLDEDAREDPCQPDSRGHPRRPGLLSTHTRLEGWPRFVHPFRIKVARHPPSQT